MSAKSSPPSSPSAERSLADALRARLAERAPVAEAADGARPAAVLVPLYHDGGEWRVLLNVRSKHLAEHKGEIAFPGGSMEESDADAQACALREAWEEMGISPEDVDVLGALDTVLTRTGFIVWPVVGAIPYPYDFKADPREVAEAVHAPLRAFLDPASLRRERRTERDGAAADRVAYAWAGRLVYGATAVILTQLLDAVRGARQADAA